jgi:hypothetical protein
VEWLNVKALSSIPATTRKKKKKNEIKGLGKCDMNVNSGKNELVEVESQQLIQKTEATKALFIF